MDISDARIAYRGKSELFLEDQLEVKEPFSVFEKWLKAVRDDPSVAEPNAVCLSTATKNGIPSSRFVLLKGYSKDGFVFFTHYTSRKGQELEENPNACLTFYWQPFSRSVRIEGTVVKLPFSEAEKYFKSRPYASQIGALCSDQSKAVEGRHVLQQKEDELKKKYGEGDVPRPPLWGGYRIIPHTMEFWQGQTDRIHDRLRFRRPKEGEPDGILTKQGIEGWIYERLCP